MRYVDVSAIYNGSDGEATKALYAKLEALGARGIVAMNLFRAMKCSARAKVYRGGNGQGSYRSQAYGRKQWSIDNLCRAMVNHDEILKMTWGWGRDEKAIGFESVLYVELPVGQVSFHSERRADGPDYKGQWDGAKKTGPERVCRWVSRVLLAVDVVQVIEFPGGTIMAFDASRRPVPEFSGHDLMSTLLAAGFAGEVISSRGRSNAEAAE